MEESSVSVSTPKKRKLMQEFTDIASACSGGASNSASVHGVLARLSPMKKGKKSKYYEGSLSDGNKDIRIFGYNEMQHKKLIKFKDNKETVNIINCEIKEARGEAEKMEVLVNRSSEIRSSSMKYDVEDVANTITLDMLSTIDDFQTVSILDITVDELELPTQVTGDFIKQDL